VRVSYGEVDHSKLTTVDACVPFPFRPDVRPLDADDSIHVYTIYVANRPLGSPALQQPAHYAGLFSYQSERFVQRLLTIDIGNERALRPEKTRHSDYVKTTAGVRQPLGVAGFFQRCSRDDGDIISYQRDIETYRIWAEPDPAQPDVVTLHFLNTELYRDHPDSLLSLSSVGFAGFATASMYIKLCNDFFRLHCEQLFAPFYNICIDSTTRTNLSQMVPRDATVPWR
jgi:hypothetical protein